MSCNVWALLTGQIRSEIYFRILLIKLCDLRTRGIVDVVVYSTWDDEIDKFPGLRNELRENGIILVETPPLNCEIESAFNPLGYEFQRTTLYEACSVIPQECFIMKIRTDLNHGSKSIFDFVSAKNDIDKFTQINSFGDFPIMYDRKVVMQAYNTRHLMFCNDRFFGGYRNDIKKFCSPSATLKIRKFSLYYENALLNGYAYHYFPLLNETWNLLSIDFFNSLQKYCADKKEDELVLPRLVLRIYATICVYIYTHVHLLDIAGIKDYAGSYRLSDFIKGATLSNEIIKKIATGNLVNSKIADVFRDELRKLSLSLPSVHGYTYEEYEELMIFVKDELKNEKLIGRYPFIREAESNGKRDKTAVSLLKKYNDSKFINTVINNTGDEFDCVYKNVFRNINKNDISYQLYVDLLKASVYDLSCPAIAEYAELISNDAGSFDIVTFDHSIKYMTINLLSKYYDEYYILGVYYILVVYENHKKYNIDLSIFKQRVRTLINLLLEKIFINEKNIELAASSSDELIKALIGKIEHATKPFAREEWVIIKALICIKVDPMPFSDRTINMLQEQNKNDLLSDLEKAYNGSNFQEGDLVTPTKIALDMRRDKVYDILSQVDNIKGRVTLRTVKKYLQKYFIYHFNEDDKKDLLKTIIETIRNIPSFDDSDSFLPRVYEFIFTNHLNVNKNDIKNNMNFCLLIEALYKKKLLVSNSRSVREMCQEDRWKMMVYIIFLKLSNNNLIEFFSMKNKNEIWLHYIPYRLNKKSKNFVVPLEGEECSWPSADRKNIHAFAAFIRLMEKGLFLSVEFSARDRAGALAIARIAGYEENHSHGDIIRLKTQRFLCEDEKSLSLAVDGALKLFSQIGDKVVMALGQYDQSL